MGITSTGRSPSRRELSASWADLFSPHYRTPVAVFAGGIVAFAICTYITTTTLPSAVDDIGGQRLYAWVMTTFLFFAVLASMLVTRVLATFGPRNAYLLGFSLFAVGSLICAVTPTMSIMLIGRAIAGLGGGLLTGLAFAVIRVTLPTQLWVRAVGLVSAMWGVGNVIGPVLGGIFGEYGMWRGSFWLLVGVSIVMAFLAARSLPANASAVDRPHPLPITSLLLLLAATVVVSVAGILKALATVGILVFAAVCVVMIFLWADRRASSGLLPRLTYRPHHPLKWIYASIVVLAVGSTVETFIPLFGQKLAGMNPLVAGLLGAAISWGWTIGQLSSTTWATSARASRAVRVVGPAALGIGLIIYGFLQVSPASPLVIIGWFFALIVAGSGIGMAFPHIATAAMSITTDESEAALASAGINTVQMVSNTFGAATAGLLVNIGAQASDGSVVVSARVLIFGFAAVALTGIAVGWRSVRAKRDAEALSTSPAAQEQSI